MAPTACELAARDFAFPRLAIVGDIRIERTAGGALLLYRLLENYPPEHCSFCKIRPLRPRETRANGFPECGISKSASRFPWP